MFPFKNKLAYVDLRFRMEFGRKSTTFTRPPRGIWQNPKTIRLSFAKSNLHEFRTRTIMRQDKKKTLELKGAS